MGEGRDKLSWEVGLFWPVSTTGSMLAAGRDAASVGEKLVGAERQGAEVEGWLASGVAAEDACQ